MTGAGFCPHCGVARQEWAKYCGSCGQSYDTTRVDPVPAAAPVAVATPKRRNTLRWILLGLVAIGLLYLSGQLVVPGLPKMGVASANVPPVGEIWFGSSFDASTFELRSKTSSGSVGQTFALVAHLSRAISTGEANLRISLDGTTAVNQAIQASGSGELFGLTYSPPVSGSYRFEITDVGGSILASGTITVA